MNDDEDDAMGIPEWVVTFGDMMSLLLTFFIMLVSLSEIKEEEQYQAMVESVRRKFGHDLSQASMVPGSAKPRNAALSDAASMGRARKLDIMKGGNRVQAPAGERQLVDNIRPAKHRAIDAVIFFAEAELELDDDDKVRLTTFAEQISGKPQKVEIRGHTSYRPVEKGTGVEDHWEQAYRRSRAVMRFLVDELNIDPRRIRVCEAGPHEPLYIGPDPEQLAKNPRVELIVLSEFLDDFRGAESDRQEEISSETIAP